MSSSIFRKVVISTALVGATALTGIGSLIYAGAQQRSVRPFIPRPSDIRPITAPQTIPPASVPPLAAKTAPSQTPRKRQISDKPKQPVDFYGEDGFLDAKSDTMSAREFTYKDRDTVVTGAKARWNKKTEVLDAEGNLALDDPKHHVTGEKAHVDDSKKSKLAIITGSVIIVLKPKDKAAGSAASDVEGEKGKGGTITCDRVDDYYDREFSILTGHLIFKQSITKDDGHVVERTVTSDHAEYDGKANKLHLFAPVDMTDTDEQEAHFKSDVFVGTKEGEETVESKGAFTIKALRNDDKKDDGAKSPEKPPTGANGAAVQPKKDPPSGTDKKQNPPPDTGAKQEPPVKKNP